MRVGLACDLGKRYDDVWLEAEREVWPLVSEVSIPCGGHAGVPRSMLLAVAEATTRSLPLGAALGYRDPASGGERFIDYHDDDLAAELLFQLGGLDSLVVSEGGRLQFVRAAGALGEAALTDRCHAWAIVNAVLDFDDSLTVVGQAGSRLLATAERHGLATAVEYRPHQPVARGSGLRAAGPSPAEIAERAVEAVAAGGIDTIWLPSGTAAERATVLAVHRALTAAGHQITSTAAAEAEAEASRICRRAG